MAFPGRQVHVLWKTRFVLFLGLSGSGRYVNDVVADRLVCCYFLLPIRFCLATFFLPCKALFLLYPFCDGNHTHIPGVRRRRRK